MLNVYVIPESWAVCALVPETGCSRKFEKRDANGRVIWCRKIWNIDSWRFSLTTNCYGIMNDKTNKGLGANKNLIYFIARAVKIKDCFTTH